MITLLITALWFFLPAGYANMGPVLANRLPLFNRWQTPLDFGMSWRGHRVFGTNKRWRGLVAGMIIATLIIAAQRYLFGHVDWIRDYSWLNYHSPLIWWLGPLFGAGALLGDAVESFFKRQRAIAPGDSWFPYDQIDFIIGGLLFTAPLAHPSLPLILAVFFVYFGLHPLFVYIGYLVGLRDKPF